MAKKKGGGGGGGGGGGSASDLLKKCTTFYNEYVKGGKSFDKSIEAADKLATQHEDEGLPILLKGRILLREFARNSSVRPQLAVYLPKLRERLDQQSSISLHGTVILYHVLYELRADDQTLGDEFKVRLKDILDRVRQLKESRASETELQQAYIDPQQEAFVGKDASGEFDKALASTEGSLVDRLHNILSVAQRKDALLGLKTTSQEPPKVCDDGPAWRPCAWAAHSACHS